MKNNYLVELSKAVDLSTTGMFTMNVPIWDGEIEYLTWLVQTQRQLFNDLLLGDYVDVGLQHLVDTIEFKRIFPNLFPIIGFGGKGHKDLWAHTKQVVKQCPKKRTVRIAALYHDVGKPSTFKLIDGKVTFHSHELMSVSLWREESLHHPLFHNQTENERVECLIDGLRHVEQYNDNWNDSAVRRVFLEYRHVWNELFDLATSDITTKNKKKEIEIKELSMRFHKRGLDINKSDVHAQERKLPKGLGTFITDTHGIRNSALGNYMRTLQENVLNGTIKLSEVNEWVLRNKP